MTCFKRGAAVFGAGFGAMLLAGVFGCGPNGQASAFIIVSGTVLLFVCRKQWMR